MNVAMPTCQCELRPLIESRYPRPVADYLLRSWSTLAADFEKHLGFEEAYVFHHLLPEDRAELMRQHHELRALAAQGMLTQAAVNVHATFETQAVERALRQQSNE